MNELILSAFRATVRTYENILTRYYPAHGSNGFTERNLTFNFSYNYLANNKEAIIWQECPLKDGKHFDTLIIDDENESIVVIEAKRLQHAGKFNEIVADFDRIRLHAGEIKLDDKRKKYRQYGLLLIDVWISQQKRETDNRYQLLNQLNSKLPSGSLFRETLVEIDYEGYNEMYHLAYKFFPIGNLLL